MRLSGSEGKSQGSGERRTLLTSVLLSAPGPIVIGLGLLVGRSSTQIADFLRRAAELAAIVCAYVIYRATTADGTCDEERRSRLERGANRFIGAMMCVAGVAMGTVAIALPAADKGNVIPGLVIAVMGLVVNAAFAVRYTALDHAEPNSIIAAQARLYRAKALVDGCVSTALLAVLLAPGTDLAALLDLAGSLFVSAYMLYSGVKTIRLA